jgi:hypothetical protein
MNKTKRVIVFVVAAIGIFIFGAIAGGVFTVRATYNIHFVEFDSGLCTNRIRIEARELFFTLFSVEESLPDHVTLEYRDLSKKVLGSDVVYLQKGDRDVMYLETTIKNFDQPVTVFVKRP